MLCPKCGKEMELGVITMYEHLLWYPNGADVKFIKQGFMRFGRKDENCMVLAPEEKIHESFWAHTTALFPVLKAYNCKECKKLVVSYDRDDTWLFKVYDESTVKVKDSE